MFPHDYAEKLQRIFHEFTNVNFCSISQNEDERSIFLYENQI